MIKGHLKRYVNSRIQVQLEEDGGGQAASRERTGWRKVVYGLRFAGNDKSNNIRYLVSPTRL